MVRATECLSPDMLQALRQKVGHRAAVAELRAGRGTPEKPRAKFGNQKVVDGDLTFDSKAEHRRWCHLQLLQRAGEIGDLRRQVPYELIPEQLAPDGKKLRPTAYVADFVYVDRDGQQVVEDVKGMSTREFRLKRKLMLWRHGIDVQEVRS